ncbi:MAG: gliding motility protein RemB, partial [Bacteroidia bacterium]|nr:gliding motility protein RemB [Bacteroidia bacterium]
MKKFALILSILGFYFYSNAQVETDFEKPPVFPECESVDFDAVRSCFNRELSSRVFKEFEVPQIVKDENYSGEVIVLFEVDAEGNFVVMYVDAAYDELKTETR